MVETSNPELNHYMSKLFESGQLKPVIDGPYKLEDVPQAFRIFGRGEHRRKMVITVADT